MAGCQWGGGTPIPQPAVGSRQQDMVVEGMAPLPQDTLTAAVRLPDCRAQRLADVPPPLTAPRCMQVLEQSSRTGGGRRKSDGSR